MSVGRKHRKLGYVLKSTARKQYQASTRSAARRARRTLGASFRVVSREG